MNQFRSSQKNFRRRLRRADIVAGHYRAKSSP